ncbi:MAG: hypothetical protein AABN95_16170 [Acidobacteriota bacterium]
MAYSWENNEWYLAHKTRWDALAAQGWQFRHPAPLSNRVGITIFREGDHYTMYVARTTPEEVHAELLERCEYHAANYHPV